MNSASIRPLAADQQAETLTLLQAESTHIGLLAFARQYLGMLSTLDLTLFTPTQLAAAIKTLWHTATERAGAVAISAYNANTAPHAVEGKYALVNIVNRDMPFLVDSVVAAVHQANLGVQLVVHPVVYAVRDQQGVLQLVSDNRATTPEAVAESWIQVFCDNTTASMLQDLCTRIRGVLDDVAHAVTDWPSMRQKAYDVRDQLVRSHTVTAAETQEAQTFITWLDNDHFTFLGVRDYKLVGSGAGNGTERDLQLVAGSGLGLLRDDNFVAFDGLRDRSNYPPEVRAFLNEPRLLLVTKASRRATVHRPVPMDAVFVKQFDASGKVVGERLFLGLFTSLAYSRNARDIPLVRQKASRILARAALDPRSHDGKALTHVLDTYPRDELFQIDDNDLFNIATGIIQLQERKRVALFVRRDPFARFVSALVYVPREAYDTNTRYKVIRTLEASFNGTLADFSLLLDQNPLARLHLIIKTTPERQESPDLVAIEAMIAAFCRTWQDKLKEALVTAVGDNEAQPLFATYAQAFPGPYRDQIALAHVYADIEMLERVRGTHRLGVQLRPDVNYPALYSLRLYHPDQAVQLSATLPMIENMGFKVLVESGPYEITLPDGKTIWLHDYHVNSEGVPLDDLSITAPLVEEAFINVWYGRAENDRFNRLVTAAKLPWRLVGVLRMLAKYMRQIRLPFSPDTIAQTLAAHPQAARLLADYFCAKFDPAQCDGAVNAERTARMTALEGELASYIQQVPNLDDDRILRRALNLLQAALRTNFYQTLADGTPKPYTAIKFASTQIDELPLPKPYAEIYVYSPRMEGVHLRGGKIARGGIRWSDRREDFRTEVLGLMKAQMVKNTVIVPVGSKGGFVVKNTNAPDPQAEGIACYQTLMRGLLDVTDNVQQGTLVPPAQVVRHDGDDPYLVVAADKGTAKFSDVANGISAEYNFWLGDAFASGGSVGYDHKHMGITARGTWEAVKRHFRELGLNTQTQDHTCIGVGDMAGDVFGNGLLQSPHTVLVAAFNYAHIFIDPNPDQPAAYAERQRLFTLGKGSWDQYNSALISAGGGVFSRAQKSIIITPEMQQRFGISASQLTPNELIRAILAAPADLLFFGGIGTFVKADSETDADVGDKANDALRITADALKVRVIGEGANLGMTQLGRVACAQRGIKLNTDAIDNSAGVDTSDHEVNIKILLALATNNGALTTEARNSLLHSMTDDVAQLVLRDNYLQTQALSLADARAIELLPQHRRMLDKLEAIGLLNRTVEFLPDDAALQARQKARLGLTRPELAVLLAYSKIWLYEKLINTGLPTEAILANDLLAYFPPALQQQFAALVPQHRLLPELATTIITNELINRLGSHSVFMLLEKGMNAATLAKAYVVLRNTFKLTQLWQSIEALDNSVPAQTQLTLLLAINRALEQGIQALATMPDVLADANGSAAMLQLARTEVQTWLQHNPSFALEGDSALQADRRIDPNLADALAEIMWLPLLPRLCQIMKQVQKPLSTIIPIFMAVDERLQLRRLSRQLAMQAAESSWQMQALGLLADDILLVEQRLTINLMQDDRANLNAWLASRGMDLLRYDELSQALRASANPDMALWTLIVRELVMIADL